MSEKLKDAVAVREAGRALVLRYAKHFDTARFPDSFWPDLLALIQQPGQAMEALSESEKEVALGQAVEFAEYVERQAKGAMRDAAKRFLSLPYSQEVAARLKDRDAQPVSWAIVYEGTVISIEAKRETAETIANDLTRVTIHPLLLGPAIAMEGPEAQ